jgi:hypothetical protein
VFGRLKAALARVKLPFINALMFVASGFRQIFGFIAKETKKANTAAGNLTSAFAGFLISPAMAAKTLLKGHWRSALAFAGLMIIVFIFSWAWHFEHLRVYAATIAAVVGAVVLAGAPFFPGRYLWVLFLCGAIFTGWVNWFTLGDMTKKNEELEKKREQLVKKDQELVREKSKRDYRIQMLQEYLLQVITQLPEAEKAEVLTRGGAVANQRFDEALSQRVPFSDEAVRDVTNLLLRLDRNNGHALYFSGEIDWHRRQADHGQKQFYAYLGEVDRLSPQLRGGDKTLAACRSPKGYCLERTAWIHHLLANDLYDRAVEEEHGGGNAHGIWISVFTHTCSAKKLHNDVGFNQLIATATIEQEIRKRLPTQTCPAK